MFAESSEGPWALDRQMSERCHANEAVRNEAGISNGNVSEDFKVKVFARTGRVVAVF